MFFERMNYMRILLTSLFCIILFACNDNKAENKVLPPPPPPKYAYYPKANVYFDTVNKDYLFMGSDGQTWTSGKQIPAAMQSMMDKSVLLDTFSQPVWKDNANHRLIYSAVLYATPKDTVEKKAPPLVADKPASPEPEVKKERKGLRKFFDKLFGRKKDKEEEKN
jgi:hypothetical protein